MEFMAGRAEQLRAAQLSNKAAVESIERDYARRIERFLDRGTGECVLKRP
jgi:hypothetical protein